jgi:sporulation protein YlmC with PRC-barrel domain
MTARPAATSKDGGGLRLELETPVRGRDGMLGELGDLVVDPLRRCVTHLVVRPQRGDFVSARLVPIELVIRDDTHREVALDCARRDFGALDPVGEVVAGAPGDLPVDDPDWDPGVIDALEPPVPPVGELGVGAFPTEVTTIYDRVPKDDVELRRSSSVESCDGHELGQLEALVVDAHARLTGVVLRHRRFWARRTVALPFDAIKDIQTDLVTLALTKRQVKQLPVEGAGGA